MPELSNNLICEPLIGIVSRGRGREEVTLPGAMALLSSRDDIEFTGIQAHQTHAWHAFLVQVGALALHAEGSGEIEGDEATWAKRLRRLTKGQDEPWALIVEDLSLPAFLQPPVPEGTLDNFSLEGETPDGIDILVTAKNHDVKTRRMARARMDHWIYAIVSLQTMQGYSGARKYGIARMNGGKGNRCGFACAAKDDWSSRFIRDTSIWLNCRSTLIDQFDYMPDNGASLMWLLPWDGETSSPLAKCDPFFVEACRRIRLRLQAGQIRVYALPTSSRRVDSTKGATGDIWVPISRDESKALTVSGGGFTYKLVTEKLFSNDWLPGGSMVVQAADGDTPIMLMEALVRGDITEGMYRRVLPMPRKTRMLMQTAEGRQLLGRLARERVDVVALVRKSVLRPALTAFVQGGPDELDYDEKRMDRWVDHFEREVDHDFFSQLFTDIDASEGTQEERAIAWKWKVLALAKTTLDLAITQTPVPLARRYRAVAAAQRYFRTMRRKHFPELFTTGQIEGETDDRATTNT
jgi:CRISPR system Cascade subunit CasA